MACQPGRQAAAAVWSDFIDCGETLLLKCGWRLCVCCVHGPCEPLFTGGCVMLCSACVICFPGVAEAARWLMISRAWSGEYAWCWHEHRLLMSVSTCGACVRAVRDYSWVPRSGGVAHASKARIQSLSRARQGSGSTRRLSTYLLKLFLIYIYIIPA